MQEFQYSILYPSSNTYHKHSNSPTFFLLSAVPWPCRSWWIKRNAHLWRCCKKIESCMYLMVTSVDLYAVNIFLKDFAHYILVTHCPVRTVFLLWQKRMWTHLLRVFHVTQKCTSKTFKLGETLFKRYFWFRTRIKQMVWNVIDE